MLVLSGVSLPLAHGVLKLLVISSPTRKGEGQEQPVVSRGLRVPVWRWQGEGEGEDASHTGQCVRTHLQGSTPKPCCLEWQQRCPGVHFLRPMVLDDSVPRYWAVGQHFPHFVCPPLTLIPGIPSSHHCQSPTTRETSLQQLDRQAGSPHAQSWACPLGWAVLAGGCVCMGVCSAGCRLWGRKKWFPVVSYLGSLIRSSGAVPTSWGTQHSRAQEKVNVFPSRKSVSQWTGLRAAASQVPAARGTRPRVSHCSESP